MLSRLAVLSGLVFSSVFLLGGIATAQELPPGGTFIDDDGDTHEPSIEAIYAQGITVGCDERRIRFCPDDPVTRGEMAAFLVRSLSFPSATEDYFSDDDTSIFEGDINRIAEAGVTQGCNPPNNSRYCSDRGVTRAEMATLLVRSFPELVPDAAPDVFTDDDSNVHQADINRIAAGGITVGCNPPNNDRYCPRDRVTRAQMATFLLRALGLDPIVPPPREGQDLPASGDVLVIGDWGAGTSSQKEVAAAMADYAKDNEVAAILTTGDNFYTDAADELMEPFAWAVDSEIPFMITWGNHDIETETRIDVVNETFGDPPRWGLHSWGDLKVIVLDSNQVASNEQLEFITSSFAQSDNPTIVAFHHPPYTCGRHSPTLKVVEQWIPLFDRDISLVLSGHDHNYQRFENDGIAYVVTGGGGKHLYELSDCPADHPDTIIAQQSHHFLVLEQGEGISVTAISSDGHVIDEFSLKLP